MVSGVLSTQYTFRILNELRKQLVDRILESLTPALAAELDAAMREAEQRLEEQFQQKLDSAVAEALHAARAEAAKEIADELQEQFSRTLQQTADELKAKFDDEFKTASAAWSAERASLVEERDRLRVLADAQHQMRECKSQPEILNRFLTLAEPFASSAAVYIMKADGLALWKSCGGDAFPNVISQNSAGTLYFKPVAVRQRTVAAVCAAAPYQAEPLDFLAESLERSIETFGLMRLQAAR